MCKEWAGEEGPETLGGGVIVLCFPLRPEVMSGQMLFEGMHPSWGRYSDGPLLYSVGGPGRCRLDSSLPPSYDQAITGEDNATTLEGEWSSPQRPLLLHYTLPPPSPPPSPQLPLLHNEARPLPLQSEDALPPYTPTDTSVVTISVPPLPIHDQQNR